MIMTRNKNMVSLSVRPGLARVERRRGSAVHSECQSVIRRLGKTTESALTSELGWLRFGRVRPRVRHRVRFDAVYC